MCHFLRCRKTWSDRNEQIPWFATSAISSLRIRSSSSHIHGICVPEVTVHLQSWHWRWSVFPGSFRFHPSSVSLACLRSYDQLDAYRMLSYKEFREHINDRYLSSTSYDEYSGDSERLGRLLLKLPILAEFETNIIEEIFFVGLIGMSEEFSIVQGNEVDLLFGFV